MFADALELMKIVQVASAIYQQGAEIIDQIHDAIACEIQKQSLLSLQELIGSKRGGYQPFPEATRRDQYSSSIAELSSDLNKAEED